MPYSADKDGRIAILGLYLLIGILVGAFVMYLIPRPNRGAQLGTWRDHLSTFVRQTSTRYQYIAPLLDSELPSQELSQQLFPYEKKIVTAAQGVMKRYPNNKISFYFNDVSNFSWVGIGEKEQYIPASLLKLPMAIAYYKLAENDEALFRQTITPAGADQNAQRNIQFPDAIEIGKKYTVETLINKMITESDNNALQALYDFRRDSLKDVFTDMQQQLPLSDAKIANENYMSPIGYSRFLLVLYNATYLSRADSETLLGLLGKTAMKDGLVAGVPQSVTVAHKFGERAIVEEGKTTTFQYHDCGIIYAPSRPYELCIMTQGVNLNELQTIAKDLSAAIYEQVSSSS